MSNTTQLEEGLRQTLRAAAASVEVDHRELDLGAFDLDRPPSVRLDELEPARQSRKFGLALLVAAVLVVALVVATVIVRQDRPSAGGVRVGESTTSASETPSSAAPSGTSSSPAPAALVEQLASVPTPVLSETGEGTSSPPVALPGPTLTAHGRARIVWVGTEWCPYCAAERWPLIVALSRFGTFSNLGVTSSAVDHLGTPEAWPNTPTLSFAGSTYSSPYVQFEAVEQENRAYQPLESPTKEQADLMTRYDGPPYSSPADTGAIPFLDIADRYLVAGAQYDASVLQGMNAAEVASALSDPESDVAKGVDGAANTITAAICKATDNQPADVCSSMIGLQNRLG